MTSSYEKIRAAAIAANPEIRDGERCIHKCSQGHIVYGDREVIGGCPIHVRPYGNYQPYRPIRLADVLFTVAKGKKTGEAHFYEKSVIPIVDMWELLKDDLSLQSQETLDAIASLLS